MLISLKEAIIVGGILGGYASGFWFIDAVGGWRSMYGVAAPLALILGVGMVSNFDGAGVNMVTMRVWFDAHACGCVHCHCVEIHLCSLVCLEQLAPGGMRSNAAELQWMLRCHHRTQG
jgi:MFS family permease